jgi:O-antigen/teichoic acid export membrane protein
LGAVAVLAWVSPTIEGFFIWQGLVSFVTVPVLATIVYRQLPIAPRSGRFSWHALVGIWKFAAGVMAITLLALLLTQLDKLILSRLLPLAIFANYALAGVLTSTLYILASPIVSAFYPQFTALAARNEAATLACAYHQAAQLTSVMVGGAAVVLMAFAQPILQVWTANPSLAQQVAPLVRILALGTLVNVLMGVPYQMQLAHGWTALTIRINVVAVVLLVPAIWVVVPRYGAIGAAWIWVWLNCAYLLVDIYFMHRRVLIGEKWRWYGQDLMLPILAAAVTALLCRQLMPKAGGRVVEIGILLLFSACIALAGALVAPMVRVQLARYCIALIQHLFARPRRC